MAVAEQTAALGRDATGAWLSRLITFAGWMVGAYLATMLAWVFVPTLLLGWHPTVVVTGSMEPLIRAGDVVLVEDVTSLVGPGTVIAFDGRNGLVIHRVIDVTPDGRYTTRGDANRHPDSTPVFQHQILGSGRVLVPYIGLSRVAGWIWWCAIGLVVAASIPLWRGKTGFSTGVAASLLVVAGLGAAMAVFSMTTHSASSSIETLTVASATDLTATCVSPLGAGDVGVELNWMPSSTSDLSGYRIYHDAPGDGTNFAEVGSVGASTTQFTHDIQVSLLGSGTHIYMVRAEVASWLSADSNTDAVDVTEVLGTYICSEL